MIPILMDASKPIEQLASDRSAGIGALSETQKCEVTEERNGQYTLTMKLPITARHYASVDVGGVIKAKPNETSRDQLFRINKISKPISGIVTISANHISYDLGKTSVLPCTATGATGAMDAIKSHMQGGTGFILTTDIANTESTYKNKIPQSARACFGGTQGSMLDTFGGEYEWDNNRVILHAHRGTDRGVVLRYGKNITDLKQEENIEATYTAVMPYVVGADNEAILGSLQTIIASAEPRILNLDLSDKFSDAAENAPTVEQIDAAAQRYIEANDLTTPKVSIKVSFIQLSDTEEYKDIAPLEHVQLCDTISVEYPKLGVSAKAKVIKTVYDTLREKYVEIEVGDARSTLAKTITGITETAETQATGYMDQAIASFSALIAQGLGLYMTKVPTGGGANKLYLHNKPSLADSQYQWTFNTNGLALSTDYGETWSAGIDSSGNAIFNALSANELSALRINGGEIKFGGRLHMKLKEYENGALFNGNGAFMVQAYYGIHLINYNPNGKIANQINAQVTTTPSGTRYNQTFANFDNNGDISNSIAFNFYDQMWDVSSINIQNCFSDKFYRGKKANAINLKSEQGAEGTVNVMDLAGYKFDDPTIVGTQIQLFNDVAESLIGLQTRDKDGALSNQIKINTVRMPNSINDDANIVIYTRGDLSLQCDEWLYINGKHAYWEKLSDGRYHLISRTE